MNHPLVLSTFISQLDECLEDISKVYSEDARFIRCKLYLDTLKKSNPRMIITTWKTQVTDKYEEHILAGDIDFFLGRGGREGSADHGVRIVFSLYVGPSNNPNFYII